jgi:thioredoxin 1
MDTTECTTCNSPDTSREALRVPSERGSGIEVEVKENRKRKMTEDDFSIRKREMSDKIILDFSAYSFCAPCRRIKPLFHELEEQNKDIDFFVIETDIDNVEFNKLAADYNIDSVPTFISLYKGNIVERLSGANPEKLKQMVAKLHNM